jgi:hypothetical protein
MKKIKFTIVAALLLGGFCKKAEAQVEFKIQRMTNSEYYTVSAIPQVDYPAPTNMLSTAQVTIKVPSGGFEIAEMQNLYATGQWRINGRCNTPSEGANYDYIYFGLENMGTKAYSFKKGQETVLFSFRAGGHCTGEVSLMDNQVDFFRAPNSMHVNVGNQMTILGAGGDAYVGNRDGVSTAECFEDALSQRAAENIVIFPNPVTDNTFAFALTNPNALTTSGSVWLYDMAGRAVYFKEYSFEPGYNQKEISLDNFPVGVYQLTVHGLTVEPMRETVVKGDY